MSMRTICYIVTLALAAPFLHAEPSTEQVIEKARQYLGGDEALEKISSIHYEAEFESQGGEKGAITIIFQKPLQQRIEVLRGTMGEITAVNDFDGWRKVYDREDEARWSVTLLDIAKIRELQANSWENLNFFRGIESRRGWIENKGRSQVDGRDAVELVFHHPRGVAFTRFFDEETGRLLVTRTQEGAEIREEGMMRVDGVVFPKKLTMSRDGEVLNEIRFRSVKLNEPFADSFFEVPSLAPRTASVQK